MREISVPTKPYIKKVLICEFGQEPIQVSQQNLLGHILASKVVNHRSTTYENRAKFEEKIRMTVPHRLNFHMTLNHKRIALISCHFDNVFRFIFMNHVNAQVAAGIAVYDSIRSFVKRFNITEDEISFDSLVKVYYRQNRKKKASKIVYAQVSC